MTYLVSSGMLNSTHSVTHWLTETAVCVTADEPQLMLTAGPSAMVYGATPGMYGTYPPSGMPGYGMQMQ